MSYSTERADSPRFSRRVKIIVAIGIAIISVLYMFACALLIDSFSQRGASGVVGPASPQPTPAEGEATPPANQPKVIVSSNSIAPGGRRCCCPSVRDGPTDHHRVAKLRG